MALSGVSPSASRATPSAVKPKRCAELGQRRDVAGRLVPEAEVLADDDRGRVQPLDQRVVDELGRAAAGRTRG